MITSEPRIVRNFNMKMEPRVDSIYTNAEIRYKAKSGERGMNPVKYPVKMARHHIIPGERLVGFWNSMVENNHLGNVIRPLRVSMNFLMSRMGSHVLHHVPTSQEKSNVSKILDGMIKETIRHDPVNNYGYSPDSWDTFKEFYFWIPNNLFIGPTSRSDDPANPPHNRPDREFDYLFETGANHIVNHPETWQLLRRINDSMITYVGIEHVILPMPTRQRAEDIVQDLSTLMSQPNKKPYEFNDKYWLATPTQVEGVYTYSLKRKL